MLDRAPSVLITNKRNELKVYQGNTVYLNNGDNFELRFFNPLAEKIGVEIIFNGIRKGDGYLVLNPGQDITLDRFLDEQRKMVFETYTVDSNNEAAVKAIEKNGLIQFNFFKEKNHYYHCNDVVNVNYNFPPKPYRYEPPINIINNYYGPGVLGATGPSGTSGGSGSSGNYNSRIYKTKNMTKWTPIKSDESFSYTNNAFFSENIAESNSCIDYNSTNQNSIQNPLETGRVEKGQISDQTLRNFVNLQFDTFAFHSICYQILPYSAMNKTIGEVRNYCEKCGYRLRKESWAFCPKCGNPLH
jgi:hypothetical protein